MRIHGSMLSALARMVDRRAPIIEPLTGIALTALLTSWAMQPYLSHALSQQGVAAQGAAQAALWLSGVLSPFSASVKALSAALICWSCAVYLNEQLSFIKLASIFCIAELMFSVRDVTMLAILAFRGVDSVRSTADLMVAFGMNAVVRSPATLTRVALESWDIFSVGWAVLSLLMIREVFKIDLRTSLALTAVAFMFRALFAAGGMLYTL